VATWDETDDSPGDQGAPLVIAEGLPDGRIDRYPV
jgi:hypothetical protein